MAENDLLLALARYAGILGLIYFALSALTIGARRATGIGLGTGNSDLLLRRSRAHANFAEYVPLALVLAAGAVYAGAPAWAVHAGGLLLIAGRLAHATALYTASAALRVAGMAATFTVILGASLWILAG